MAILPKVFENADQATEGTFTKSVGATDAGWIADRCWGRRRTSFGYPRIPLESMVRWVVRWVIEGGLTFDKPTHFETRDGRFQGKFQNP